VRAGALALAALFASPAVANAPAATFGVEARLRHETYRNNLWGGAEAPDDSYGWLRVLPSVDLRPGPGLRLFGELIGAWARGVEPAESPVDETGLDLLQGYAQLRFDNGLSLQGGRQLLVYGSERLISRRWGPNVPQAFDGGLARVESTAWRVDAFFMRPVENKPGAFDDGADDSRRLWSLYATRAGVDAFYIGYRREAARFEQGTGKESRHTLGGRFFGASGGWTWDVEGHFQFGDFAGGDIRAWSIATDVRHTFAQHALQPFVELRANAISGDRGAEDRTLNTFNAMFPRGKYFGEIGQLGPYNLVNLHGIAGLDLGSGWTLRGAAAYHWRESLEDGVYNNPGQLVRASGGSPARAIGAMAEAVLGWSPARGVELELAYAVFEPGRFIKDTGPASTVHFVGAELQWRY